MDKQLSLPTLGETTMQTIKQLLSDLKKAKAVFGYVAYNNDDGTYLQMVKADIVFRFKNMPQDTPVKYTFDGGLLHIN
jgi:hypothetical protein